MSSPCECCKALWVKFELTTPLTRYSDTASAKVYVDEEGHRCYWQGDDPDPNFEDPEDSGFDVFNLEARKDFENDPPYQFFGFAGDIGIACLDDSDPEQSRYRIVHLPPPRIALILEPIDPIPPAERDLFTGKVQMGAGECWVLKRNSTSGVLDYVETTPGQRKVVVAWNLCPITVGEESGGEPFEEGSSSYASVGCTLVYAAEDRFGDLVITEVCDFDCGGGSSSSSYSESEMSSSMSGSEPPSSESEESSTSDVSESSDTSDGSESDKSTAIVPATWSSTGYTALFVAEMPEVRFDDMMQVCTNQSLTEFPIDPKFVEVCEPDSIRVCGAVPEAPVLVGASVSRGMLIVRLAQPSEELVTINVRLTGIRRGFAKKRFPERTREQFEANERFIRSAYPGA